MQRRKEGLKEIPAAYFSRMMPGLLYAPTAENASEEDLQYELERLLECLRQVKEKAATRTCFSLIHENLPEYLQVLQNVYEQDLEEIVTDNKSFTRRSPIIWSIME